MSAGPASFDRSYRRPGSAYVLVLGAAVMLGVIGLAGLKLTRVKNRLLTGGNHARNANMLALSAIEVGLAQLDADTVGDQANWRTTFTSGTQSAESDALANGTLQWMLVDEHDDNLGTINDADPVRLYGIGRVGDITRVYSVLLAPTAGQGLSCLGAAVVSDEQFWIDNAGDILAVQRAPATTNNSLRNYGTLQGDFEVSMNVTGSGTITGTTTSGAAPRTMPAASMFDYYVAAGTAIDALDLSVVGGTPTLQDGVLSPTSNRFSKQGLNAQGIYVIDCAMGDLRIRNMRIVGTVVVLNCTYLYIEQGFNWEPAVPNYPALLVDHTNATQVVTVQNTTATLSEGPGLNFNPPGTPHEGVEDNDEIDVYPSLIKGLVYTNGNIHVFSDIDVQGVVVSDGWFEITGGRVEVLHDSIYLTNPPPGFSGNGPMAPMPGTWARTTLP